MATDFSKYTDEELEQLANPLRMTSVQQIGKSLEDDTLVDNNQDITVAESTARGLEQGLTLGFADEIKGALGAVGQQAYNFLADQEAYRQNSLEELYKDIRDRDRKRNAAARKQNPKAFVGAEIGGSVLAPLGLVAKGIKAAAGAGKAATAAQKAGTAVKESIKVGGTTGLVAGAGYTEAETVPEMLEDVAKSGLIGAGAGAVIGGGASAARGIVSAARAGKKIARGAQADELLTRRINREKIPQLTEELKEAQVRGEPVLLPDIAGDEIQGLTRSIGKISGGAKNTISQALEDRSSKEGQRVLKQLSKNVSEVDAYFGKLDDLAKGRAEMAAPLYEKAFKGNKLVKITNKNKKLFSDISEDVSDAKKKFRMGDDIPNNSIIMLDAAKKSLDDKIGVAVRQGENQRARVLVGIKKDLVDELDKISPEYKEARKVFSDFASMQTAQEQGLKFNTQTSEQIDRMLKTLSPSEKEAFKIGVREKLQQIVHKTALEGSPAKRIFGKLEQREQLKTILGNQYDEFARRMEQEIRAVNAKNKIISGSRTDFNIAEDAPIFDAAIHGQLGMVRHLTKHLSEILKARYTGVTRKNAKEIAEVLTSQKKSIAALERIANKTKSKKQKIILKQMIEDYIPRITALESARMSATTDDNINR